MSFAFSPAILEQHMSDQQRLADMAPRDDIAAMHRALAFFYHEQLIRTIMEAGLEVDTPLPGSLASAESI